MHGINQCYSMYYEQVDRVLFNLLDSHDTDRLMERCHGNADTFLAQLAILFTMQGAPGIYYGTEIGMDGGGTKANRKCMPWEEIDAGSFAELTGQVKRLIAMRRQYQMCIRDSNMSLLYAVCTAGICHFRCIFQAAQAAAAAGRTDRCI